MRKKIRQQAVILTALLSLSFVGGCGAQPPVVDMNDENMTQVSEMDTPVENETITKISDVETDTSDKNSKNMTQVSQNGSGIKENEEYVYFFGTRCIYTVDKATDHTRLMWKNDAFAPSYSMFDGKGILFGEMIYFLERVEGYSEDDGVHYEMFVLSKINTDGSGYEQAVSRADDLYGYTDLYYSNGILYLYNPYNSEGTRCYAVLEDGSLGAEIPAAQTAFLYQKGAAEGSEFSNPVYLTDDEAFFIVTAPDKRTLERVDLHTKERTVVGEIKGAGSLNAMYQEGTLYYMLCDENRKTTVGYLSAEDGTAGELFELNDTSGYVKRFSPYSFGIRVSGDDLYYMDMRDYDAYLVRICLPSSQQPTYFEEPVYCTKIHEVGTLVSEQKELYRENNPEQLIGTADIQWLLVDASFAGAEKINAYLQEHEVANALSGFENNVRRDEEFFDDSVVPYSLDSDIACVRYFDGTYVSFIQEGYDYFGGAHGMPWWTGYVFDLETGERLFLSDLVSNTEEELKDFVAKYFGEKIDENPGDYWADAKEVVRESVSLETTDFVLTDAGICFYMHPYNISAYAMGFSEVTIPYAEFNGLLFSPEVP